MSKKLIAIIVAVVLTATAGITTAVVVGNKKEASGGKVDSGYSDSVDSGESEDEYAEPEEKAPTLEELNLDERTFDTTGSFSDTVKWKLSSDGECFVVYGNGVIPTPTDYQHRYKPEVTGYAMEDNDRIPTDYICSIVKYVVVQEGITKIEENGLYGFDEVKYIYLPKSLETFESNSNGFNGFFKGYVFPSGNDNYKLIDSVLFSKDETVLISYPSGKEDAKYTIPSTVKEISEEAFESAKMLHEVTIPSSVEKIGECAFGYSGLKIAVIPDSVKEIGEDLFRTCMYLEEAKLPIGITKIPARTFFNCNLLKSIDIPDGVTDIEEAAFGNCESLEKFVLPSSVKEICGLAFSGCDKLSSINLPDGLERIGGGLNSQQSFQDCTSLKSIVIPAGTKIDSTQVFWGWTSDQTIYFEDSAPGSDWNNRWDDGCNANIVWDYKK